jgi:hypothetical protein
LSPKNSSNAGVASLHTPTIHALLCFLSVCVCGLRSELLVLVPDAAANRMNRNPDAFYIFCRSVGETRTPPKPCSFCAGEAGDSCPGACPLMADADRGRGVRHVRCPKCRCLLQEPGVPVYQCGGCGATLRGECSILPSACQSFALHYMIEVSLLLYFF